MSGLKDYALNDKEKEALEEFKTLKNKNIFRGGGIENFQSRLEWREFQIKDLFEVKSNPQLNKDSFIFKEDALYPYFTRSCLNNGILGYVEYLDEEHKIKGNSIAVGMLGMQFFYMEKDFYAGQFTKTIYPKFKNFSCKIAHYFIAHFNKQSPIFKGVLVRDFEKVFYETNISLPTYANGQIAFDFMKTFIKAIEKESIKDVVLWSEKELKAYKELVNSV